MKKVIKDVGRLGSTSYGLVESIRNGLATVILRGSTRRMTNLPVVDVDISVGEVVIIDQVANGKPFVRRISSPVEISVPTLAQAVANRAFSSTGPVVFSVNRTGSDILVGTGGWAEIDFDNVVFDDYELFPGYGSRLTLPMAGVYMLFAQVAFNGTVERSGKPTDSSTWAEVLVYLETCDVNNQILLQIKGSNFGTVVQQQGFPIDGDPTLPAQISAHGLIVAEAGEEIWCQVYQATDADTITIKTSSDGIYPKFSGYRINRTQDDDDTSTGILGVL